MHDARVRRAIRVAPAIRRGRVHCLPWRRRRRVDVEPERVLVRVRMLGARSAERDVQGVIRGRDTVLGVRRRRRAEVVLAPGRT